MPTTTSAAPCRTGRAPFQIPAGVRGESRPATGRLLRRPLEALLAFPELNALYARITDLPPGHDFGETALAALDVDYALADTALGRVPRSGPLIVVANHPFGGVDALVLTALLRRVRPDVKLLTNHLLRALPELAPTAIFVDPFGGRGAARRNVAAMRHAVRWVRAGGVLAVFPAGEVSRLELRSLSVTDAPWNPAVGRIARQTGAPVLPVYFGGRNSVLFQAAGLVHPLLRTLMLPRELLRRRHSTTDVRVGGLIPSARLAAFAGDEGLTAYLRARTYLLGGRPPASRMTTPPPGATRTPPRRHCCPEPPAAPEPAELLAAEVAALPARQHVAAGGRLSVLHAESGQIPALLREIGRLREVSFRAVGEGTGRPRDLDRFDGHYSHLFVWHHDRREVVGAYRLGLTDRILERLGPGGLYTSTLFRYRRPLLDRIGPAVELGRSFVRPEYQKEYAPLLLLWKGIARFVADRPRYKKLFGPVSISNDYQCLTKQILVAFLRMNRSLPNLGRLIEPRNAPRLGRIPRWVRRLAGTLAQDVAEVDEVVAEVEAGRAGIPVLLRQYLKLNATLLGFNVDPAFGNALDALMLVDLTQVPRAVLARYMGAANASLFLEYHGRATNA